MPLTTNSIANNAMTKNSSNKARKRDSKAKAANPTMVAGTGGFLATLKLLDERNAALEIEASSRSIQKKHSPTVPPSPQQNMNINNSSILANMPTSSNGYNSQPTSQENKQSTMVQR